MHDLRRGRDRQPTGLLGSRGRAGSVVRGDLATTGRTRRGGRLRDVLVHGAVLRRDARGCRDRKSTRLNSSHMSISYAVCCLKKKKKKYTRLSILQTKKKKNN